MQKIEIIDNDEKYISLYGKDTIHDALQIALDCRKFEIEMYWKRANYFAIIIGAIFIAYYSIKEIYMVKWLLSYLGYSLSYAWICLNRGSKFWQENWEKNIEYLSSASGVPVFNIIRYGERNQLRLLCSYPYSVSRLNLLVSIFAFIAWLLVIIFNTILILADNPCCLYICLMIMAGLLLFLLPLTINGMGKGFMARDQFGNLFLSCNDMVMIDKENKQ